MVIAPLKGALSAAGCYALLCGGEVCGGHLGALGGLMLRAWWAMARDVHGWLQRDSVMGRRGSSCDGPRLAGEGVGVADARDAFSRHAGAMFRHAHNSASVERPCSSTR